MKIEDIQAKNSISSWLRTPTKDPQQAPGVKKVQEIRKNLEKKTKITEEYKEEGKSWILKMKEKFEDSTDKLKSKKETERIMRKNKKKEIEKNWTEKIKTGNKPEIENVENVAKDRTDKIMSKTNNRRSSWIQNIGGKKGKEEFGTIKG